MFFAQEDPRITHPCLPASPLSGQLEVAYAAKDQPAANAGLQAGDFITAVNGIVTPKQVAFFQVGGDELSS